MKKRSGKKERPRSRAEHTMGQAILVQLIMNEFRMEDSKGFAEYAKREAA